MAIALILVPLLLALVAFAHPRAARPSLARARSGRRCTSASSSLALHGDAAVSAFGGWLALDNLGRIALPLVSVLFFVCSLYVPATCALRPERPTASSARALLAFLGDDDAHHRVPPPRAHVGGARGDDAGVGAAPLLQPQRALARGDLEVPAHRLGRHRPRAARVVLPRLRGAHVRATTSSLLFEDLVRDAPQLSRPWLHAAFVLLFVGYGTKMGLAPMHTWKPDAYGEAPGVVGALLAGGLTSCAFLALLRFYQICAAAGEGPFAREIMIVIGLLSMAVAGVFMARPARLQADARLLERRAHGHPGARRRASAGSPPSARSCTWSTTGSPRASCSCPPATSTGRTAARRSRTVSGALRRVPVVGGALPGRLLRRSPDRRRSGRS